MMGPLYYNKVWKFTNHTPVYVIVQKGLRYFENQACLDYLEQHYKPVKEIGVNGVCTTRVYEIEGMAARLALLKARSEI